MTPIPESRGLLPAIIALCAFFVVDGVSSAEGPAVHQLIDHHIDARLSELKVESAGSASDAEFLRRVSLDLTGVIPEASSARSFIESDDPLKRVKLIDRLLAGDEFARHMATVFDVMLMERRPDKYVTTPQWRAYLAESFTANKPLNVLVGEVLGADGVDESMRPAAKFYLDRAVDKDTLVRDIGRLFLGRNLQCAQCHDHPDIDDYLHQHYHGLSVFVAGSKTFKQPDGVFVLQEVVTRQVEFASVFEPDATKTTGPRLIDALMEVPEFPDGEEYVEKPSRSVRSVPKFSLRALLSQRLPSDDTPEFSRNMVNRLWALMMGRGLVHPLDMHHVGNPPSHTELLDDLAIQFASSGYDVRGLLRELALSAAYQRSSLIPEGVTPESLPVDSYAVATMKGLSPEQLFESALMATQANAVLEEQIDRAIADEEATAEGGEPIAEQIAALRQQKRTDRVAQFVAVFGGVPGQPEGEFSSSLPQALFLANSETVSAWVAPQRGNLADRLVALDRPADVADTLFLTVLTRLPVPDERQLVKERVDAVGDGRKSAITALVWSLLASSEFRLNH